MKKTILIIFLAIATLASADNVKTKTSMKAACTGANPCKACKNCKYCKRCAKQGLTCGVCKK
jgi:hypothetical protein